MRKLMSANLSRLRRDKAFWAAVLAMLLYSAASMLNGCRQAAHSTGDFTYTLEHYYFAFVPFLGIFIAAFTGLYLGAEYSDGALRNKLIVGHRRPQVYLANLLTCSIASCSILLAGFAGGLVGIPTLGTWKMGLPALAVHLLIALFMAVAWCSLFTLVGMLTSNRAVGAVLCILLSLGIILIGGQLYSALCETETLSNLIVTAESGMQMVPPTPNPNYISGTKRLVYAFIVDFLPSGQSLQMADLAIAHPLRMLLSSALIFAASTACGTILFQKKDLK